MNSRFAKAIVKSRAHQVGGLGVRDGWGIGSKEVALSGEEYTRDGLQRPKGALLVSVSQIGLDDTLFLIN